MAHGYLKKLLIVTSLSFMVGAAAGKYKSSNNQCKEHGAYCQGKDEKGDCIYDFGMNLGFKQLKKDYPEEDIIAAIEKVKQVKDADCRTVRKALSTPLEAKVYCLTQLRYESELDSGRRKGYWRRFNKIHETKSGDCKAGATAAAAILSDDGYSPRGVIMYDRFYYNRKLGHVVFVYKDKNTNKWGSIGINGADNTSNQESIEDLVIEISDRLYKDYLFSNFLDLSSQTSGLLD